MQNSFCLLLLAVRKHRTENPCALCKATSAVRCEGLRPYVSARSALHRGMASVQWNVVYSFRHVSLRQYLPRTAAVFG
jgi:hypothetical protein